MAEQMRLLYVGSIKPENAAKLLGLADVDRCPGQRREPGRSEFSGDCQGRLRHLRLRILQPEVCKGNVPDRFSRRLVADRQRNSDPEAALGAIGENHIATVAANDGANDGKAEPDASRVAAARPLDPMKWGEYALHLICGDAGAVVVDGHGDEICIRRYRDPGTASVFDRVIDEVCESPLQRYRPPEIGKPRPARIGCRTPGISGVIGHGLQQHRQIQRLA